MPTRWMTLCCFAAALTALATTGSARAEACGDAADGCPKGFTCKTYEAGCATIDIACAPDDAACIEKQEAAAKDCETAVYETCEAAECTSNDDCGEGMVCHDVTEEECSGSGGEVACPEGQECEVPANSEPTCTTTTTKLCTPKYALPCATATDCGEGFTCEAQESCTCVGSAGGGSSGTASGSGGSASSEVRDAGTAASDAKALPAALSTDAGAAPGDGGFDDGCECTIDETAPKRCELEEIPCENAGECPSGWSCEEVGGVSIGCATSTRPSIGVAGGGSDGGASSFDAGAPDDCVDQNIPGEFLCRPPYADVYARAEADSSGAANSLGGGGQTTSTKGGEEAAAGDDGSSADAGTDKSDDEGGICSVTQLRGTTQPGLAGLLFALVGLVLAARRRKQH